jgi:hypothetical protein
MSRPLRLIAPSPRNYTGSRPQRCNIGRWTSWRAIGAEIASVSGFTFSPECRYAPESKKIELALFTGSLPKPNSIPTRLRCRSRSARLVQSGLFALDGHRCGWDQVGR